MELYNSSDFVPYIQYCPKQFEKLNQIILRPTAQCLYILIDGGNNSSPSGNRQQSIDFVKKRTIELEITEYTIQIDDRIDYHFKSGHSKEFLQSFISAFVEHSSTVDYASALLNSHTETVRSKATRQKIP